MPRRQLRAGLMMEQNMRFTSEEAFEARDCGEPILLNRRSVERILRGHDADGDYFAGREPSEEYDAADVLEWLGY